MQGLNQSQFQKQSQVQRLSQRQIQAINMLAMNSRDLREEIFKFAQENPALEIVFDPLLQASKQKNKSEERSRSISTDAYNSILESNEAVGETLQQHLISQLNMMKLSPDEYSLCESLIYNLDKNGFYGSMRAPETLLDKTRPLQNKKMLENCIELIQNMDPVGICCKGPEESLYVQAKVQKNASDLTLFILDGNLEFLNPPEPEKVLKKLEKYRTEYHQKSFAKEILLDKVNLSIDEVSESIRYITSLNLRPAGDYISDSRGYQMQLPDVVLKIEKKDGTIPGDDFSIGRIYLNPGHYLQIRYASGTLPEVRISSEMNFDKKLVEEAKAFIENIKFRESTIVLQGCAIARAQKEFFEQGPGHLNFLTRRQIASEIGVHESTVSRTSAKHNSKYFETEWGLFPASYFFTSGVNTTNSSEKISSEVIKAKIIEILETNNSVYISDSELCRLLNEQGIKIARRTVAKYRQQAGIENSYKRQSSDKN